MSEFPLCRRRFLELTGGLGTGLLGAAHASSGDLGHTESSSADGANPYAHELVVRYHDATLASAQAAALAVARTQGQRATIGVVREELRFFKLHLDPAIETDDRDRILDRLADRDPIEDVGIETEAVPDYRPNDPGYKNNSNDGQRQPRGPQNSVDVDAIGLESVWKRTRARSMEVAICDSRPVYRDHEDLTKQVAKARDPVSIAQYETRQTPDGKQYSNPPFDPSTPPGEHSTAIAGVIAATHNDVGIAGACQAALRSVSPATVGRSTDLLAAVLYAIQQTGANVVNLSASVWSTDDAVARLIDDICASTDRYQTLLVVSGGNVRDGRQSPGVLARRNETIAVSASNRDGIVDPDRSLTGPGIDITAPGYNVLTTTYTSGSTSSYGHHDGSSLSAPLVAGIAALGMARHPGLKTNMAQLRRHIKWTATPIEGMNRDKVGRGMINAARLIAATPIQTGVQTTTPTPPPAHQGPAPSIGHGASDQGAVGAGGSEADELATTARIDDEQDDSTAEDTTRLVTAEQFESEASMFDAETEPWTPDEIVTDPMSAADPDEG